MLGTPENTVCFGSNAKAYREAAEKLLGRLTAVPQAVLRADDDRVGLSHVAGRGAPTSVEVDEHFVYLFTIRDGRIAGLPVFASEADALATLVPGEEKPPTRRAPARGAPPSAAQLLVLDLALELLQRAAQVGRGRSARRRARRSSRGCPAPATP